ncbi:erythromycin esterase family protein [Streptomyces sp. 796.1]|uniref:erythromycin esterase family protein n=1 Tax=Streptomyces sp. 796.1 TaxID=3163029 RepID=UPI0039C8DAD8
MHAPTDPSEPAPGPAPAAAGQAAGPAAGPRAGLAAGPRPAPATVPGPQPQPRGGRAVRAADVDDGGSAAAAVRHWIASHAHPLPDLGARAPLHYLAPLTAAVGSAQVVGIGAATRGAAELTTLAHQLIRHLVTELGFRSLALDEDWSKGQQYDAYVTGAPVPGRTAPGPVDPRDLLADAWAPHRSAEFLAVLLWIRAHNQRHPDDPVRIVGLDYGAVQAHTYDAVLDHVAATAPEHLAELRDLYAGLRPSGPVAEHVRWYADLPDQRPVYARARRARERVASLPAGPEQALALRQARVIEGFYAYHGREGLTGGGPTGPGPARAEQTGAERAGAERVTGEPTGSNRAATTATSTSTTATTDADAVGGPDGTLPLMAENAIWWHHHTGQKVIFWSGLGHTAVGAPLTASFPPAPASPATRWSEGGALRRHFGAGYASVGLMFGHGRAIHAVAPPSPALADAVLSTARPDAYLLDLHAPQPVAVHGWFDAPATVRLIGPFYEAARDADYHLTGGRLTDWCDVLAWVPEVTPLDWL